MAARPGRHQPYRPKGYSASSWLSSTSTVQIPRPAGSQCMTNGSPVRMRQRRVRRWSYRRSNGLGGGCSAIGRRCHPRNLGVASTSPFRHDPHVPLDKSCFSNQFIDKSNLKNLGGLQLIEIIFQLLLINPLHIFQDHHRNNVNFLDTKEDL